VLASKKKTGGLTFRPTGPDGRGWGIERKFTDHELEHIQYQAENEAKRKQIELERTQKMVQNKERAKARLLDNEDERWENAFKKTIKNMQDKEKVSLQKRIEDVRQKQKLLELSKRQKK